MKVYCEQREILRTGKGEHLPLSPSADIGRESFGAEASSRRCVVKGGRTREEEVGVGAHML